MFGMEATLVLRLQGVVQNVRSLGIEGTLAGPRKQQAAFAPSVVADSTVGSAASVDGAAEDIRSQKSS